MALKLGVLDQSIIFPGQTAAEALQNTVKLAKLADALGYERFWVSEHHDSDRLAGSSPEVLIAYLLAQTDSIRIGSGGVMLQHYQPYKVAENFNVLATLAPGRVELGIGRAPGGLPRSTKALQTAETEKLEDKLTELQQFLRGPAGEDHPLAGLKASPLPSHPANVFVLGTGAASAELAAERGLPYVFALFINNDPEAARQAFEIYRRDFNPCSGTKPKAKAILALSVIAADTEEEADAIASSLLNVRVTLASGKTVNVSSLEQAKEFARQSGETYTAEVREADVTKGTKETVRSRILELAESYGVEEFVFTTVIEDYEKRARSLALLKEAFEEYAVSR